MTHSTGSDNLSHASQTIAPDRHNTSLVSEHTDGDAIIRCIGLTKVFRDFWLRGRVRAVDGIDLEVRRGEVLGLLGPNGSGKSTTIKMILGLLHPTSGRVAVFGKRPEDVATKRFIGYLPEESYLYPFLNARETLDYFGRLFHQGRHQRQRRIDMLLEMVGLEAVGRRPIGEYSKGMQRRIGLAAALINDPKLLILDEPTNGLDPLGTRQIKDLILDLSHRGKTILLCSHLLADVEEVCDRVAIMFGGKIRVSGTVDELLAQQDMTTLQINGLDDQTVSDIESLLQTRGRHIEKIDKPRQKLESLFLEIVHRAQAEGIATSGARVGGPIAAFLQEEPGHEPQEERADSIIDRLVGGTPTPQTQTPHPAQQDEDTSPKSDQSSAAPPQASSQPRGDTPTLDGLIGGSWQWADRDQKKSSDGGDGDPGSDRGSS